MSSQTVWSEEEVEILKREYPTSTAKEVAESLGRTTDSVYQKASRLGINTESEATVEERTCGDCGREYLYSTDATTSHNSPNECRACYDRRRARERKTRLGEEVFGAVECEKCGYSDCVQALSFHHEKDVEKRFQLSSTGLLKKWEDVVEEAEKCRLLCENCHQQIHCTHC